MFRQGIMYDKQMYFQTVDIHYTEKLVFYFLQLILYMSVVSLDSPTGTAGNRFGLSMLKFLGLYNFSVFLICSLGIFICGIK